MMANGIIESSSSEWSSPCVIVPKSNGVYCFCTDFRKVNAVTKSDLYPIPRVEDCIDRIDVSKFDLLKGYWQGDCWSPGMRRVIVIVIVVIF